MLKWLLALHLLGGVLCLVWQIYIGEMRSVALKERAIDNGTPTNLIFCCLMVWEILVGAYLIGVCFDSLDNAIINYYKQKEQE